MNVAEVGAPPPKYAVLGEGGKVPVAGGLRWPEK